MRWNTWKPSLKSARTSPRPIATRPTALSSWATRPPEHAMPRRHANWATFPSTWPGGTAHIPPAGDLNQNSRARPSADSAPALSMATAVCSVREVLALTAIAALFPIPELALTVFEHNPIPAGVTLQTGLPALRIGQSDQRAVLDRVLNCGWEYPFIKSSLTIKRSPACWVALRSKCG